jgi:hypothetical protein
MLHEGKYDSTQYQIGVPVAMLLSFSGQKAKQPVPSILRADTTSKDVDFSELQIPQPKCTASHL